MYRNIKGVVKLKVMLFLILTLIVCLATLGNRELIEFGTIYDRKASEVSCLSALESELKDPRDLDVRSIESYDTMYNKPEALSKIEFESSKARLKAGDLTMGKSMVVIDYYSHNKFACIFEYDEFENVYLSKVMTGHQTFNKEYDDIYKSISYFVSGKDIKRLNLSHQVKPNALDYITAHFMGDISE